MPTVKGNGGDSQIPLASRRYLVQIYLRSEIQTPEFKYAFTLGRQMSFPKAGRWEVKGASGKELISNNDGMLHQWLGLSGLAAWIL